MTSNVLVSVIIPTYNRAAIRGRAIQCAHQQHVPGTRPEVIVVDDESTDSTAEVVTRFPACATCGSTTAAKAPRATPVRLRHVEVPRVPRLGRLLAARQAGRRCGAFEQAPTTRRWSIPAPSTSSGRIGPIGKARAWPCTRATCSGRWRASHSCPMSSVSVRADCFAPAAASSRIASCPGALTGSCGCVSRRAGPWVSSSRPRRAFACMRQSMLSDASYMEPAMLAGVDTRSPTSVVARRARGREGSSKRACT